MQKDNMMITGDALLDFGDGHKIKRSAKPGWYIYHSLPASHQAIFFPGVRLEKNGVMTWNIKFLPTTRWQPKCIKPVMHLKNSMARCLNFPWVGVSTTNNMELCADAKKSPTTNITCALAFGLNYPGIYANVLPQRRKPYITKSEYKENQCKI